MSVAGHEQSELLRQAGFRHAFFTRTGGVSTGLYASLNFSSAATDSRENVAENVRRAARALEVDPARVFFLSQVHGVEHRVIQGHEDREQVLFERGDVLLSAASNVAVGVRSADCVPVLLADRVSGAVAAVHAGWRGVELNACGAGVRALRELIGADGALLAAIGPHITLPAFEVGEDVAERLRAACPGPAAAAVVVRRPEWPRPHVDLARIVRAQLQAEGIDAAAIELLPGCTVTDAELRFSYRRDGKASGRHLSAIVPRGF